MTHKRQLIRQAMMVAINAAPSFVDRTEAMRARPTEPNEAPVAIVYTLQEESEYATIAGDMSHTLTVAIELRASAATALGDELDGYCDEVQSAVAADQNLRALVVTIVLSSTSIGLDGEGESRQAIATMVYQIRYETDPSGS